MGKVKLEKLRKLMVPNSRNLNFEDPYLLSPFLNLKWKGGDLI